MKLESPPSDIVLDIQGTLDRFGGDKRLFQEIIAFFLEDSPPLLCELKRAALASQSQAVREIAHALRGLIAGCGGIRATQAAQRVERAGEQADLENIRELIATLESELELLWQTAKDYRF